MFRYSLKAFFSAATLCLSGVLPSVSHAQADYPNRPIQIVTSFPAGMATDLVARVIADKLGQKLNQSVAVINKPGGGGVIATDSVAKAAPDGYTLLVANPAMAVNPFLYKKLPYNTSTDFAGIALLGESPYIIVISAQLGAKSVKEFVEIAKQSPKKINYASGGVGGATHLACALFAAKAGIELTHVPYTNMSNLTPDLWANRTQMACFPPASAVPLTQDGKMIAIGTSAPSALTEPINVPSIKESTGIDYIASNWNAIFAPGKTPKPILQKLAKAMEEVLADEDVKQRFKGLGLKPNPKFLGEMDAYFAADMQRWGPVVKASGASLD